MLQIISKKHYYYQILVKLCGQDNKRGFTYFWCYELLFPVDFQFKKLHSTKYNQQVDGKSEKACQSRNKKLAPSWTEKYRYIYNKLILNMHLPNFYTQKPSKVKKENILLVLGVFFNAVQQAKCSSSNREKLSAMDSRLKMLQPPRRIAHSCIKTCKKQVLKCPSLL